MKRMLITLFAFAALAATAQESKPEGYKFTDVKSLETTPVKNQSRSGTCWSFSGIALVENEILRNGGEEVDLSEMWVVRHTYMEKAEKYVRMHGTINFAGGGATHDVMNVIRKYGIVPEEAYKGLNYGTELHQHGELDAVLKAYVEAIIKNPNRKLSSAWKNGVNAILDTYLGPVPEKFTYKGVEYTPKSFAASLKFDPDQIVSLTSFSHHPFYEQFAVEVPDNWAWGLSYNLPLDEFMKVMEAAVDGGYSILWASDVSEKGFAWNKGLAVIPEADLESMDGTEQARWVKLTEAEKQAALYKFDKPGKEKTITQEVRQEAYDDYETTDDHGMLIMGKAADQAGNKYFKVKNSWGTAGIYGGYFYASYPFVAYKTMNIMVNKAALPKDVAKKLGLK